jgi:hypothetical protein
VKEDEDLGGYTEAELADWRIGDRKLMWCSSDSLSGMPRLIRGLCTRTAGYRIMRATWRGCSIRPEFSAFFKDGFHVEVVGVWDMCKFG